MRPFRRLFAMLCTTTAHITPPTQGPAPFNGPVRGRNATPAVFATTASMGAVTPGPKSQAVRAMARSLGLPVRDIPLLRPAFADTQGLPRSA